METKRYIGIDLHRNGFTCCLRLENGRSYLSQWRLQDLPRFVKKLRSTDLLWKNGMNEWAPARSVPGLFATAERRPASSLPAGREEAASRSAPGDVRPGGPAEW